MAIDMAIRRPELPRIRLPAWLPFAGLALLGLMALGELSPPMRAIQRLHVAGTLERVDAQQVRAALEAQLALGFFAFDVARAQQALVDLPWVAQARVSRRWPGVVRVRLWERHPVAVWNDAELLDDAAVLFAPPREAFPPSLPQLGGPPGSELIVFATWHRLQQSLSDTPLALSALSLDARGEWQATTLAGVELRFGGDAPEHSLDLLTRVLLPRLGTRLGEIAYVDLRYSNGFAVGWKAPVPPNEHQEAS